MKVLIVEKLKNGVGQRETSRILGIPRTTVQGVWRRYKERGQIDEMPKCGRPRCATDRDRRNLCLQSRKHPFLSAREVLHSSPSMPNMSIRTVRRILSMSGLHGRIAAKKPLLNRTQIRNRLSWCKTYLQMDPNLWKNFVFSDEARIELYSSRRQYVRRPVGQRFNCKYTMKTVKYGGPSIMIWGAIKGDGTKVLCKCPPILNSEGYQTILDSTLIPFISNDSIFMQDGAPCHRSKSTLNFLDSRHICLLSDWPAQSPDLNILENLWSVLKSRVQKRQPNTANDLWVITKEEWDAITKDEVIGLFNSIQHRLTEVIRNKGQHIKY